MMRKTFFGMLVIVFMAVSSAVVYAFPPEEPLIFPTESSKIQTMLSDIDRYLSEARSNLSTVLDLQKAAREKKDMVLLNCIDEKVRGIREHITVIETAANNIVNFAQYSDIYSATQEYAIAGMSHQRVHELAQQAAVCRGTDAVAETEVRVDVPLDSDGGYFDGSAPDPVPTSSPSLLPS